MEENPLVSIVIPVYNEEKDISECLNTLLKQTYKNFEIIVVDDGSTDKTIKNIKKDKRIKIINQKHKGPGAARNLGAKKSNGEYLSFVDADMSFPKNFIKSLIEFLLKNKGVIGVSHEWEKVKNTSNIWSRCWGRYKSLKKKSHNVKGFRVINKKIFLKMGGFDSQYGYADDQTFWIKYKKKPVIVKGVFCYHKNPEKLRGVYNQSKWIGASIDNVFTKNNFLKYITPFFLILISPLLIPFLTLKRCYKNNDWSIIIYMLIFTTVKYFGTIIGIINKIFWKNNIK